MNKNGHTEIQKRWVWVETVDPMDSSRREMTRVMQYHIPTEMRTA